MKPLEIRQAFSDLLKEYNTEILEEKSLLTEDPEVFYRISTAINVKDYFLGIKEPANKRIAVMQRCIRAKKDILRIIGKEGVATLFNTMMSYFFFNEPNENIGIEVMMRFFTEKLNLKASDIYCVVNEKNRYLIPVASKFGIPDNNFVIMPEHCLKWSMGSDDGPTGIYVRFFIRNFTGLVPIGSINNANYYNDKQPKIIDSSFIVEMLTVVTENKPHLYETKLFKESLSVLNKFDIDNILDNSDKFFIVNILRGTIATLSDGAKISSKNEGYILRKFIREAALKGYALFELHPFLYELTDSIYTDLEYIGYSYSQDIKDRVKQEILDEENFYLSTLKKSLVWLNRKIRSLNEVLVNDLDEWNDSRGIPVEVALKILKENNIKVDYKKPESFNVIPMYPMKETVKGITTQEWLYKLHDK